jgi:hypothetical protein
MDLNGSEYIWKEKGKLSSHKKNEWFKVVVCSYQVWHHFIGSYFPYSSSQFIYSFILMIVPFSFSLLRLSSHTYTT